MKRAYKLLIVFLLALMTLPPAGVSKSLAPQDAAMYLPFYPAHQLGLLTYPGYALTSSQMSWVFNGEKPNLIIGYHRAVPFYEQDVTLHFSSTLTHYARSHAVAKDYQCEKQRKQVAFEHPRYGPYILCLEEKTAKAYPGAKNQTPIPHTIAFVRPVQGNKLPHISINLHGFAKDIIPLLQNFHTYASEP